MIINKGLVLEGGGMRCVYTAGVLESFLENRVNFPYIIGVSAGAVVATSFISGQAGRNKRVTIDYIKDKRYLSLRNLIFKKSIFCFDFLFNQLPNRLVPFDYESFFKSKTDFVIGITNCVNGKPDYFSKSDFEDNGMLMKCLKSTSSIPFVSPLSYINGNEYLDGGLSDAVPVKKSIEDGNKENVIILTQNRGYRKSKIRFKKLIEFKYRGYPEIIDLIKNRHKIYNERMDYIEELEKKGDAIVIRPSKVFEVGRLEKNRDKLIDLYSIGKKDGMSFIKNII